MTEARPEEAFAALRQDLEARGSPEWIIATVRELAQSGPRQMNSRPGRHLGTRTGTVLQDSLIRTLTAVRGGPRVTIIDEWHRYNEAVVGTRNARIVRSCLGLAGARETQTEVAEREGITRQRVSQIMQQYEAAARAWKPPLIPLAVAEAAARRCGQVVTALEWNQALPVWLQAPRAEELNSASVLLDYGWFSGLVNSSQDGIWFQTVGQSPQEIEEFKLEFDRLRRFVLRQLGRAGAVQMERLSKRFGQDGAGLAHALIHDHAGVDEADGWLLPRAPRNSVLVDRAKRVLSVVSEIPINRLKPQIARAVKSCPPHHIIGRILERDLELRPDARGWVDGRHLNLNRRSLLSPGELAALRVLESERVLTSRGFQKAMVAEGFSAALASVLAGRSVVLTRPKVGYVSAIDCDVTEADFRRLQEVPGQDQRIMLGHRNLPEGGLELRYRIDPDLLATTSLALPPGRLEVGPWSLPDQDRQVEVHRTYFTGWRDGLRAILGERARILVVSFYPRSRTVSLRVIG